MSEKIEALQAQLQTVAKAYEGAVAMCVGLAQQIAQLQAQLAEVTQELAEYRSGIRR
jgi:uncharacterized protein involved in exopolysaccharide biosynthesis